MLKHKVSFILKPNSKQPKKKITSKQLKKLNPKLKNQKKKLNPNP